MKEALGWRGDSEIFDRLESGIAESLEALACLSREGGIDPFSRVRVGDTASRGAPEGQEGRPLRLGVFPTAANPMHWMHLLGGLMAAARFRLDKVVYIIAGSDPRKPCLLPEPIRHRMAQEILRVFSPFLVYSPLAAGGSDPGEVNVFRLLRLNAPRRIHAFYIAGTDHCHRLNPSTGRADTVQKLEDGIHSRLWGFDGDRQRISLIFLERGEEADSVDTPLEVNRVSSMSLRTSSTMIRDALAGGWAPDALSCLPFTVFSRIQELGLYRCRC